jgi:ribosomal protein L12E/L44/L45/RPP1/RPP2
MKKPKATESEKWANRIVGHGMIRVETVVNNPANWREHPLYQREALVGVLEDVGIVADILVNKRTGRLVDGHLRVAMAKEHGITVLPVRYIDVSEDEEREILATLDPIGALAEANQGKIKALVESLDGKNIAGAVREMWTDLQAELAGGKGARTTKEKVNGEAALLDQAVQLRPEREYIVIVCEEDGGEEWAEIQTYLGLKRVRRGGYEVGNEFDDIGIERVIPAKRLLAALKKRGA